MAKITLNDVTNINAVSVINDNFDRIEQEFQERVLYRDNFTGENNTVQNDIDLNGFDLLNVGDVVSVNGRWATINELETIRSDVDADRLTVSVDKSITLGYRNEAQTAASIVQTVYDNFDDRYLGVKTADPGADNDGNTLVSGALYFRSSGTPLMRVYNGTTWQDVGSITTTITNLIDPALYSNTVEAEQGINNTKVMTPLRTKEAIDKQVKQGFTATGPIVLPGNATNALEAVPKQQLDAVGVPTGAVMAFVMFDAPTGWLVCGGQAVSRTTYAGLFAKIGTLFGAGDGATTFVLPDLRGEFIRGLDSGRGVDPGRVLGTGQADELKSHTHAGRIPNAPINISADNLTRWVNDGNTAVATSATGGAETRPRNIALLYCIKT